jgi:hypothetical protein
MRIRLILILITLVIFSGNRHASRQSTCSAFYRVKYTFGRELTIKASFPEYPNVDSVGFYPP